MNNYHIAQEAAATATNSAGSAMAEQEKFAESLQGRINRLDTAWNELTVTMGDAVINDTLITIIESLGSLAKSLAYVIDRFGLLPPLFGVVSGALILLSGRFRDFSSNLVASITNLIRMRRELTNTKNEMIKTDKTARSLSATLKGIGKGIGVTALFSAIGVGIEWLISTISDAIQKNEEMEKSFKTSTESIANQSQRVAGLVREYERLSTIERDVEQEEKYVQLQNELAQLLPVIKVGEDTKGNAILANSDIIREQVELLERQIEIERELAAAGAPATLDENRDKTEKLREEIAKLEEQYELYINRAKEFSDYIESGVDQWGGDLSDRQRRTYLKDIERWQKLASEEASKMAEKQNELNSLTNENVKAYEALISQVKTLEKELSEPEISWIARIAADSNLSETAVEGLATQVSRLKTELGEGFSFIGYSQDQINTIEEVVNNVKNGSQEWENHRNVLSSAGIEVSNISQILGTLRNTQADVEAKARELNVTVADLVPIYDELGNIIDFVTGEMEEHVDVVEDLGNSYDDAISSIKSLNGVLNELNEGHGLSADSIGMILEKYPHLLQYLNDETALRKAIQQEIENETNVALDAIHEKLMAEENFTKTAMVLNSDLRQQIIKQYGVDLAEFKSLAEAKAEIERRLINQLSDNWAQYYRQISTGLQVVSSIVPVAGIANKALEIAARRQAQIDQAKVRKQMQSIEAGFRNLTVGSLNLSDVISKTGLNTDKASKSAKNHGKQMKESVYIADTYAEALEQLNTALEKLNSIKNNYSKHSNEYRKAIQQEISLLQQKARLLEDQRKTLQQQINSGRVQQTGIIQVDTNTKAIGNSISDRIWNFLKSKGFSDTVVAGIMGNLKMESNLNPSAVNRSSGAYGIAQWLGSRKTALSNFARSRGTSMNDLQTQLDFLWKELNSTEKRTLNYLRANQNASASTIAAMFDKLFERSEGTHVPQRQKYANQFLSQYAGKNVKAVSQEQAQVAQSIDQAKLDVLNLEREIIGIHEQIEALQLEIVQSQIAAYDHQIKQYSATLAELDYRQQLAGNNSFELMNIENERLKVLQKQRDIQKQSINFINQQIRSNNKLTQAQKDVLNDELISRTETLIQLERELLNLREENANRVIDMYKRIIEVQREQAIKAIEDELNAFEKAHRRKMELLEDELDAYEEIINAQKEALREQKDEEDHNKRMEKYQERMQKLQSEYAKWQRDDSAYGQRRARELAEEIQELQEEIAEYQSERQYEQQTKALDKLLEEKQKQIENEKELEEQAYETGRERLERDREDIERHYENLLNDERAFAEMRSQILAGNIKDINNQLDRFASYIQKNMRSIGESISENLIDQLVAAGRLLSTINGAVYGANKTSTSNLNSFLDQLKKNGFAKGGYVGHDGVTFVHGGERVLNKEDNKNFERMMSFIDRAKSWIDPIIKHPNIPKLPAIATGGRDININMPIHIQNMNGTKQDAERVFGTINTRLTQSGILPTLK